MDCLLCIKPSVAMPSDFDDIGPWPFALVSEINLTQELPHRQKKAPQDWSLRLTDGSVLILENKEISVTNVFL